jgi:predicted ATP-grasp superfamily ATP-dependent carboligase
MNGRFWGWHSLTHFAGVNYPVTLFRTLRGGEVRRKCPKINAAWVRTLTDAPTVASEVLRGRMSPLRFIEVLFNGSRDAVWSWKDPMPFFMEVAISPFLWWKKGF